MGLRCWLYSSVVQSDKFDWPYLQNKGCQYSKKVQVGKDQEKAQSEKAPTPKTKVGKNQTNNQVLIP